MPTYEFLCPECELEFEKILPMSQSDDPQVCECGATAKKQISMPSFILKGDDWVSKNLRIKGQMAFKNKRLDKKQSDLKNDGFTMTLAPNVDGERTDSWSDAQKLAASKGKKADTYTPQVQAEKKKA